jgi:DNA-binding NtrC family response regulator
MATDSADSLAAARGKLARGQTPRLEVIDSQEPTLDYSTTAAPLVFADPASRSQLDLLQRIAPSDVPVLLRGDSGTGKEAIARYLHELSRRKGPLVVVRCGAATATSSAGELPATNDTCCESWFAAASGGTLLLDEVSELQPALQAELLQVLQQRQVNEDAEPDDVRLISTTTVILTDAAAAGRFRFDLLYRLNIATLTLLPLTRRKHDIVPLADHFIALFSRQLKRTPAVLSTDAAACLTRHPWTGNVRELKSAIRLAVLLTSSNRLGSEHLLLDSAAPAGPLQNPVAGVSVASGPVNESPNSPDTGSGSLLSSSLLTLLFRVPTPGLLERLEGEIVAAAFEFAGRNQVRTATLLGISRNVLRTLLKKYRLYDIRSYSFDRNN